MWIHKILNKPLKTTLIFSSCLIIGFLFIKSDFKIQVNAFAEEQEMDIDETDLDVILIDNQDYDKDRKGPVSFPHKAHAKDYNLLCWDCHHEYEDGENIYSPWGTTLLCADCHDPYEKFDEVVKLKTAYHLNCKTCHEKMKIYGDEPFAYRKCIRCHLPAE